jgi:putative SOS response-associated peptidase YedK
MCGRFFLATAAEVVAELFGVDRLGLADVTLLPGMPAAAPLLARYNIAPTQLVAAVRDRWAPEGAERQRELVALKWGLVPFWADDPSVGGRMINARSESAATSAAFKHALERRRCLLPADGFFEWKKVGPRAKQPVAVRSRDHRPLAMAGLWERWRARGEAGPPLETVTILTCPPNELLKDVHDRMPVILEPGEWDRWLDPAEHDPGRLAPMMDPYPAGLMAMHPVGPWVNSARNDDSRCVEEFRPETSEEPGLFGGAS